MQYTRIELPACAMQAYIPDMPIDTLPPRRSIVICPGGGYAYRSAREAEPIALVFASMGFNCFVVEYRVAPATHPAPVHDVAQAVAWVRAHHQEIHADPNAIAVMGFSAGGHAAGSLGVYWHDAALMAQFGLTPEEVRPNAMVLCYPVITGGEFAHRGSFVNLTGSEERSVHAAYSLEDKVTGQTPPTFLWHTFEDGAVPVENTLMMASALRRAGIVTEVHIFPRGGHGLALCNPLTSTNPEQNLPECAQWTEMAARFLNTVM
ncbi:MAG: alpha/beta hydrolase [Aristaeellaceae bacterium]